MKLLSAVLIVVLSLVLALAGPATAQISITSGDILKPEGYSMSIESALGPLTVNNGSPGGPGMWDFTALELPNYSESEVVNVAGTPFASDFPTANYCLFTSSQGRQDGSYSYMSVTSSMWTFLGVGFEQPETSFVQKYNPAGQIPLPVEMNDSWVFETGWTDTTPFYTASISGRSHQHVDAYGTMMIPLGDYSVLRIMSYDTVFTHTIIPPYEFSDTTSTISYAWWGKDPLFVAETSSMPEETDPNFTEASWVERAAPSAGIEDEETDRLPRAFSLEQNYPNPFNPHTEITFSVKESSDNAVDLSIYSLRGTKVATLLSERLEPGIHTAVWNGRNEKGESLPSGVYFYRLTSGGESITKKMVLAR
jgi:hypothetical protein